MSDESPTWQEATISIPQTSFSAGEEARQQIEQAKNSSGGPLARVVKRETKGGRTILTVHGDTPHPAERTANVANGINGASASVKTFQK